VPIPEDHLLMPKSPNVDNKVSGEAFVQAFANQYDFRPVILGLFNVYGPKQSGPYAGVIIEFIRKGSRDEPPVIFVDDEQTRDFVHVSDVVEAAMLLLRNEGLGACLTLVVVRA